MASSELKRNDMTRTPSDTPPMASETWMSTPDGTSAPKCRTWWVREMGPSGEVRSDYHTRINDLNETSGLISA